MCLYGAITNPCSFAIQYVTQGGPPPAPSDATVIKAIIVVQSFLYIAWYFVFSVLGNFNYFFYAAHLLDVAVCFKTLGTILQSVTHNGKQVSQQLSVPGGLVKRRDSYIVSSYRET